MSDQGIKVSDVAAEVLAASAKDLIFTSAYSTLKVFSQGEITLTTNGSGDGTASITHGFGYAPAFLIFRKGTAAWTFLDGSSHTNAYFPGVGVINSWTPNDDMGNIHCYTTSTTLNLVADAAGVSKTYTFKYYLLVERSEAFTDPDSITLDKDIGFKVSKPGKDVITGKEYDLIYSSKYKALQYYEESLKEETLSLPLMFSSFFDQDVEEGTYVDFAHGLGYPPLFMAYARSDINQTGTMVEVPFGETVADATTSWEYQISAFCDATKIRISFYRRDSWDDLNFQPSNTFAAETLTIKLFVFTEDLSTNT